MSGTADAIEAAILHGVDSQPTSTYREDRRADSGGSAHNTDDELGSDLPSDDDDDLYANDEDGAGGAHESHSRTASSGLRGLQSSRTANRGEEGATHTGPKGVLRDRQLRAQQESSTRAANVNAINRKMESVAMTSESYNEQVAREKREAALQQNDDQDDTASRSAIADLQAKERRKEQRIAELKSFHSTNPAATTLHSNPVAKDRYFGHLREVDERGYVSAIDNEDPRVPVVIHIYSKAVAQCNMLTNSLSSLARQYPRTKFLQVQAAAIGFGRDADADAEEEEFDEYNSKTLEVLPTVLVYKAGRLMANLVRVDLDPMWGRGAEQDVRDLLEKYGALPTDGQATTGGGAGDADGDDDDE
ncbi:Phosducin domain-containing protein [Pseudozyma hubeiensis]|nr:Phosducin domain-containing protein [Pseudozyma hubeiensis]